MAHHITLFFVAAAAAIILQVAAAADTYVVLDSQGWIVPTNGDAAYRNWTSGKDFEVGDTLVFNFSTGGHDVAEVSKAAYDACNGTSPLTIQTTGPANFTLQTSGAHYYICTVTGHCLGGQKLSITVEADDTPPASSPPTGSGASPSPDGSSPPSPSSGTSIASGGFMSVLLSAAAIAAFLY